MITCGTDIIEIQRIKESIDKYGEKFLNRVYTKAEIEYCESKKSQKYQHYAARFAAKEAIYKAISNNIEILENWTDIEILNEPSGRPYAKIHIKAQDIKTIDISMSHCKEYSIANVVVEW